MAFPTCCQLVWQLPTAKIYSDIEIVINDVENTDHGIFFSWNNVFLKELNSHKFLEHIYEPMSYIIWFRIKNHPIKYMKGIYDRSIYKV